LKNITFLTVLILASLAGSFLLLSCGGGGGGSDDATAPTGFEVPDAGSTISESDAITITFDETMETASLVLGADLVSEAHGAVWSSTTSADDTLAISPASVWAGTGLSLSVDAHDLAGNAMPTMDLHYTVSKDYTLIQEIQYTTDPSGDSPYKDEAGVTTEGIVTAVYINGYYIQDPAGGGWSGLYVIDSSNIPTRGDRVRVTGTVAEYYNLTQLNTLTAFEVESSGNTLPAAQVLATGDVSQEMWEAVLVRVESVTVTDGDLGYGEWSVSDGSGDVVLDDKGSYTYTPTTGDVLNYIVGPLDFSYSVFKMLPRDDLDMALIVD